jgi:N-acetylglucosaminyldiphosphoundecaprenol N-acetyl-beta-D-mannosaminyltransferase
VQKYFNINLEFDHDILKNTISTMANNNQKGYVCFVDLTSLVFSYRFDDFKNVLNNALINSCDGSYIALIASLLHKKKLRQYIGPDFFKEFIFKKGNHIIIGSTIGIYNKIINRIQIEGGSVSNIDFIELPFNSFEDFDYVRIASYINEKKPNYIWVSLGAPKQEYFMHRLLPFIDSGIILGIGAALNFFSGEIKDIPKWIKMLHLIWIYRLIAEPKKQMNRLKSIIWFFPKMILEEKKNLTKNGG